MALPSTRVATRGGPIGRQPWLTALTTLVPPLSSTATAPEFTGSAPA